MFSALPATIDRLLATVLLAGARRSWPLLRLIPSSWLRPLLAPTARRLRYSLARGAMAFSTTVTAAIVLLAVLR
jgi:hypothetical protein